MDTSQDGVKAKKLTDEGLVNKDDERAAEEEFERTGEPVKDKLGNESGAS